MIDVFVLTEERKKVDVPDFMFHLNLIKTTPNFFFERNNTQIKTTKISRTFVATLFNMYSLSLKRRPTKFL